MTKKGNPKSKTLRLSLIPKPEWETEVRAFKEICARNGIEMSRELYERAVKSFLRDHNWPPGNSQTTLPVFSEKNQTYVAPEKCGFTNCEGECEAIAVHKSGYEMPICGYHLRLLSDEPKWRVKT
jgi:hypothetical protein